MEIKLSESDIISVFGIMMEDCRVEVETDENGELNSLIIKGKSSIGRGSPDKGGREYG